MKKPGIGLAAAIVVFGGFATQRSWGVVSSTTNLDISQVVGANTFYANGYTGSGAIIANIEAGLIWNQHQSLTNVTVQLPNSYITPQYDMHATWVGSALAGEGSTTQARGIAYGATLWSGAIATSWATSVGSYSTSFNITEQSFATPYVEAMINGVNGVTANVLNSSYSGTLTTGSDYLSITLDALLNQSGKLLTVSAGNNGPFTDTVGLPAAGTNAFVVGALQSDTSAIPYGSIAPFSSVSPTDFYIPAVANINDTSGTTLLGVRSRVDITAPGTNLELAHYGSATGGNAQGSIIDNLTDAYNTGLAGTSFSSPIVCAGAALVVDAGKVLYGSDPHAIDGRVLKAVLMNSAFKPAGWNNGQTLNAGVITTTQSLDNTYGSGILNLNQAYTQYTSGTADVPTLTGGIVQPTGWAYGAITHIANAAATNDYVINQTLKAGTDFNATLDWYSDETVDSNGLNPAYGSFDNLDLKIFELGAGSPTLIAQSISLYNSAEELSFLIPTDGTYMVEVDENNYVWNFNGSSTTPYGLAWSDTAVPEPAGGAMLVVALTLLGMRRRRKQSVQLS